MKIFITVVVFLFSVQVYAQDSVSVFGSIVKYSKLDSSQWHIVQNGLDQKSHKYIVKYTHVPIILIEDSEGKSIKPVITIICEKVPDSMDVVEYSTLKRAQMKFKVNRVIGPFTYDLSYRTCIGYEGEYGDKVIHKVLIGHFRRSALGVEVICDATDGVYNKVVSDMKAFLKSVTLKDINVRHLKREPLAGKKRSK